MMKMKDKKKEMPKKHMDEKQDKKLIKKMMVEKCKHCGK